MCSRRTESGRQWLPEGRSLTLSADKLHVWRASLDLDQRSISSLRRTLSRDELDRAERYRYAADRQQFIIARGLLRSILGRYLNTPPARLRFSYGPNGKPAVAAQSGASGIHFNLSHSQHLALYAVACNRRVGIDLEYVRPIPEISDVVERFFSAQERAEFRALAAHKQLGAFYGWWTRKEAYLKARGPGLALPLDRFDVSIAPEEPAKLLAVNGDGQEASRWSLCDILPANGYAATLAVEGHDWHLSFWDLDRMICGARSVEECCT